MGFTYLRKATLSDHLYPLEMHNWITRTAVTINSLEAVGTTGHDLLTSGALPDAGNMAPDG